MSFRLRLRALVVVEALARDGGRVARVWSQRGWLGAGNRQIVWRPDAEATPQSYLIRLRVQQRVGQRDDRQLRRPCLTTAASAGRARAGRRRRLRRAQLRARPAGDADDPLRRSPPAPGRAASGRRASLGRRGQTGRACARGRLEPSGRAGQPDAADRFLAERPLLPPARGLGRACRLRAARRAPAPPRPQPGRRRAADQHLAGLQLLGRRRQRRSPTAGTPTPSTTTSSSAGPTTPAASRPTTARTTAASCASSSHSGKRADYFSDEDLERFASGAQLARLYDLIVFAGHHEYETARSYDLVTRYRDLGGNLAFLSADNFYWRVVRRHRTALAHPPVAHARSTRGEPGRRRLPGQRLRQPLCPVHDRRQQRRQLALPRPPARGRRADRHRPLRDRIRHAPPPIPAGHDGARPGRPRLPRPEHPRPDDLLQHQAGAKVFAARHSQLRGLRQPGRHHPVRQPLAELGTP